MSESSITVTVRIRPFSAKEAAQLAPSNGPLPFLGDGGLGGSPAKPPGVTGAPGLRTNFLRPIISPVDDKVLIFDPPDNNPLSRLYAHAHANYMSHGKKKAKDMRYAFDRVFDDKCGQTDVFEGTTRPLLDGILNGFNASVFAYGATGCGKTHTISGTPEDPGVIFLTMKELYRRIAESKEESEVNVRLSYLEIYNETIRDLLSTEPTPPGQGLQLREDQANKISVIGISEHTPESPEHVLQMIQEGNQRRTMSPTEANAVSSRSHAVLQINVTQRPKTGDVTDETTSASLNIIDLAGSERAAATSNNGARMKEGANINKSLLALGNCINALCQAGGVGSRGRHIPYRNSKLTRLLKFSLGGNCKTVMIVCVSPSSGHYDETSNTLKYANQAKNIRTKVSQNLINVDRHVAQYVQTIHELRQEVAQLKAQLVEQGGMDSEQARKRKRECKAEVSEVVSMIGRKAESAKEIVKAEAHNDGAVRAATTMAAVYRERLAEVEALLAEHNGRASPGEDEPSDLTSERDMLRQLVTATEASLQAAKEGQTRLENRLNILMGSLGTASRNSKFDDEAAERVKSMADARKAEIDAQRHMAVAKATSECFRSEMVRTRAFMTAACRSTVGMKDLAGELEWRASKEEEWDVVAKHLRDMAAQLTSEAARNDALFQQHTGAGTSAAAAPRFDGKRSVSKRRTSLAVAGPSALSAPRSTSSSVSRTRPAVRRVSQVGVARPTMPSSPAARKARTSLIGTAPTARLATKPVRRTSLMPQGLRAGAAPPPREPGLKSAMKGSSAADASKQRVVSGRATTAASSAAPPASVRFADDSVVTKGAPRRSTTPDYPPPPSMSSDSGSSSTDWIDQPSAANGAAVLAAMKAKPRVSRMPMLPPAPSSAPMSSLTGNAVRKTSAASASRRIDDILEGGEEEDDDDEDDVWDDGSSDMLGGAASSSTVSSKPVGQAQRKPLGARLPPASSPLPLSSFAAPTKSSMAKASRALLGSDADDHSAAPSSSSLFGGVDENAFLRDQQPFTVGAGYPRHAPYGRRESTLGPERRMPSGLGVGASRRLSSAEGGSRNTSLTGGPGSRHSSGGVGARVSSAGIGGSGGPGPNSMLSKLSLGGAPPPSAGSPNDSSRPPSTLSMRAWGPPGNSAARVRASRDSSAAANTSIASSSGGDAKVRRSAVAPAQPLVTSGGR